MWFKWITPAAYGCSVGATLARLGATVGSSINATATLCVECGSVTELGARVVKLERGLTTQILVNMQPLSLHLATHSDMANPLAPPPFARGFLFLAVRGVD